MNMNTSHYEFILSNLPDTSVILYNEKLDVLKVFDRNQVLAEILPRKRSLNNLRVLITGGIEDSIVRLSEQAIKGSPGEESLIGKSGQIRVRAHSIRQDEGSSTGILMIQGNRGLVNDYKLELEKEKDEAEETSEIKSRLMASISHEIRTPLNAIIGFIEQLGKTPLNKVQEDYVKIIDKSSIYLLDLVNEILTYSKLESGEIKLDDVDFNLETLIKEIFTTLKMRADRKMINLSFHMEDSLKGIFRGDGFRLKQVIMNLLSNAIKFTEYGFVELRVRQLEKSGDRVWCRFEVIDTGIGIPEEKKTDIFREYKQASSGIARKHGGTGLGLTISQRLTQIMGGRIDVTSTVGKGSTFTLYLPLKKSKLKSLTRDIHEINTEVLAGKRTLIVDDDAMNRMLGHIILEGFNMEVDLASGGAEAMEWIDRQTYDIVLLDIHMPEISGLEVGRYIRASEKNRDTPIMIVTAEMIGEELDRYRAEGMNDFLIKPYREIHMFNKISNMLLEDAKHLVAEPQKIVLKQYKSEALYDLEDLRSVTRGNKEFFNEMIQTFITNVKVGMEQINEACERQNWDVLRETAHRLIPSYKHLRINKVVSDLIELKEKAKAESDPEKVHGLINGIRKATGEVVELLKAEKM